MNFKEKIIAFFNVVKKTKFKKIKSIITTLKDAKYLIVELSDGERIVFNDDKEISYIKSRCRFSNSIHYWRLSRLYDYLYSLRFECAFYDENMTIECVSDRYPNSHFSVYIDKYRDFIFKNIFLISPIETIAIYHNNIELGNFIADHLNRMTEAVDLYSPTTIIDKFVNEYILLDIIPKNIVEVTDVYQEIITEKSVSTFLDENDLYVITEWLESFKFRCSNMNDGSIIISFEPSTYLNIKIERAYSDFIMNDKFKEYICNIFKKYDVQVIPNINLSSIESAYNNSFNRIQIQEELNYTFKKYNRGLEVSLPIQFINQYYNEGDKEND